MPPAGQNPYVPSAASLAETGLPADALAFSREEVEAFAGRNGLVYWSLFEPYRQSTTLLAGFNMAACALGMTWLFHRKMYWEATAAAVMSLSLGFWLGLPSASPTVAALLALSPVLLMATLGFLGNGLYLRRLRRAVVKARAHSDDPAMQLAYLARVGGVSWFAPFLCLLLYFIVIGVLRSVR